jgi:hypothetical protein
MCSGNTDSKFVCDNTVCNAAVCNTAEGSDGKECAGNANGKDLCHNA